MLEPGSLLEVAYGQFDAGVSTVEGVDLDGGAVQVGEEPEVPPVRPQPGLSAVGEPGAPHDQSPAPILGFGDLGLAVGGVFDVDSTICEVHGYKKQGAAYGYTKVVGYHPIVAVRADSGEVLHARMRKGSANTARGARRFIDELVARLRRAGAGGEIVMRFDSGFWSNDTIKVLARHGVRYTMAVRANNKYVAAVIAAIDENAWV